MTDQDKNTKADRAFCGPLDALVSEEFDMKADDRDLREIAKELKKDGMRCNCDLDNWEPERSTGHSWVCRIHKMAMTMKYRPRDLATSR